MEHPQILLLRSCPGHILISKWRSRVERPHIKIPKAALAWSVPTCFLEKACLCVERPHIVFTRGPPSGANARKKTASANVREKHFRRCTRRHGGFPVIMGTLLTVPIVKITVFWGLLRGPPI